MGKRDDEQLGAYLVDRIRGEQTTRPPRHPEAEELAQVADMTARGYEDLDAEGDPQGSKYALMRYIERHRAILEEQGLRRSWVGALAFAVAGAVVLAAVVLGAYVFGVQQGTQMAARPTEPTTMVPVNIPVQNGPPNVEVHPYPGGEPQPVAVPEAPAAQPQNLGEALEAKIDNYRAMAIKNGTGEREANLQTDYLRVAVDLLMDAHAIYDRDKRIGGLGVVVEHLARMQVKFPKNELTVLGLKWGADIAQTEMGDLSRAEVLYSDTCRMCDNILR